MAVCESCYEEWKHNDIDYNPIGVTHDNNKYCTECGSVDLCPDCQHFKKYSEEICPECGIGNLYKMYDSTFCDACDGAIYNNLGI